MRILTLIVLSLWQSLTYAQEDEALLASLAYLAANPSETVRFVWLQEGVKAEVMDLAMNYACPSNKVSVMVRGVPISDQVLAYELARFDPVNPERLTKLWDSLAISDPVFHINSFLQEGETQPILAPHLAKFVADDISENNLDTRLDVLLTEMTNSTAPILEGRFLIEQLLVNRYYDFRDINVGDNLFVILARAGYFFGSAKELEGVKANWIPRSNITGDERVVVALFGTARPTPAFITYDLFDGNNDPENRFVRNLTEFNKVEDGNEVFIPMANGLIEFVLTNGEAEVVPSAPDKLAVDYTKPRGHDTTLIPGLSCIACHTLEDGKGMYRAIENGYRLLPPSSDFVEQAELDNLYGTDLDQPDGILGRARRDFITAISPLAGSDDGADNLLAQELVKTVYAYRYSMLTTEQQVRELSLPEGTELKDVVTFSDGEFVDPEVYLALRGVPLSREVWSAIRVQLASRINLTTEGE